MLLYRIDALGCREAVRSSNAAVVLQTLVPQAREIFKLLAQAQLSEQAEEDGGEGPTRPGTAQTALDLTTTVPVLSEVAAGPLQAVLESGTARPCLYELCLMTV